MTITVGRRELLEAINRLKGIVSPRTALPILSQVLVKTGEGCLLLSATDLKVSVEYTLDCNLLESGSFTVHCHRLAAVLGGLAEGDIEVSLGTNNVALLKCGRSQVQLYTMSPDEFPPIRSFENTEPMILDQGVLRQLFSMTSFAVCTDQRRYNLTGVFFEIASGGLRLVATDGRRMSMCLHQEGVPRETSAKVIIPGKATSELEHLLRDEGEVRVYVDENRAGFAFDGIRVVTALIEGPFPNPDMVVPKKHDKEAVVDTAGFLEAVRRSQTMTSEKFNAVRLLFDRDELTLRVTTPDVGESEEKMAVDYRSDPIEIGFNPDFLVDVLRRIQSDQVWIALKDNESPGVIKPCIGGAPSDSYINVIMPIRI